MKKTFGWIVVVCLLGAAAALGGCTRLQQAHQVGGVEPATWVYIATSREQHNGVFRCVQAEGGRPVCVRAEMQY